MKLSTAIEQGLVKEGDEIEVSFKAKVLKSDGWNLIDELELKLMPDCGGTPFCLQEIREIELLHKNEHGIKQAHDKFSSSYKTESATHPIVETKEWDGEPTGWENSVVGAKAYCKAYGIGEEKSTETQSVTDCNRLDSDVGKMFNFFEAKKLLKVGMEISVFDGEETLFSSFKIDGIEGEKYFDSAGYYISLDNNCRNWTVKILSDPTLSNPTVKGSLPIGASAVGQTFNLIGAKDHLKLGMKVKIVSPRGEEYLRTDVWKITEVTDRGFSGIPTDEQFGGTDDFYYSNRRDCECMITILSDPTVQVTISDVGKTFKMCEAKEHLKVGMEARAIDSSEHAFEKFKITQITDKALFIKCEGEEEHLFGWNDSSYNGYKIEILSDPTVKDSLPVQKEPEGYYFRVGSENLNCTRVEAELFKRTIAIESFMDSQKERNFRFELDHDHLPLTITQINQIDDLQRNRNDHSDRIDELEDQVQKLKKEIQDLRTGVYNPFAPSYPHPDIFPLRYPQPSVFPNTVSLYAAPMPSPIACGTFQTIESTESKK